MSTILTESDLLVTCTGGQGMFPQQISTAVLSLVDSLINSLLRRDWSSIDVSNGASVTRCAISWVAEVMDRLIGIRQRGQGISKVTDGSNEDPVNKRKKLQYGRNVCRTSVLTFLGIS